MTTQLRKSVPETSRTTGLLQVADLGYSSSYSLTEYFGKELIAALLYEDLKDREVQEQERQHASSIHGMWNTAWRKLSAHFSLHHETIDNVILIASSEKGVE